MHSEKRTIHFTCHFNMWTIFSNMMFSITVSPWTHWFSREVVICIRQRVRSAKCWIAMATHSVGENTNLKEWMCKRTRETKMQLCSQRQCNFNPSQKLFFPRIFAGNFLSRSDFWALSCFPCFARQFRRFHHYFADSQTTVSKHFRCEN